MNQSRVKPLNDRLQADGDLVVYVMSRDQRVHDNHALLAAQQHALQANAALVVVMHLSASKGLRRREHFAFMTEALPELKEALDTLNIGFVLLTGDPLTELSAFSIQHKSVATYFDFSPMHGPRRLQEQYAQNAHEQCFVVDTHNIIPMWELSNKQEFAAYTIRPKVHKQLASYLVEPEPLITHPLEFIGSTSSAELQNICKKILANIEPAHINVEYVPGEQAALLHLQAFIPSLDSYALGRNDIAHDQQSGLSPYLHFGHIASLRVALECMYATGQTPQLFVESRMPQAGDTPNASDGMNALFEEMIVRKELSDNFCYYAHEYTSLASLPDWAQRTLTAHASDKREFTYTQKQWADAQTHDIAWNAAQMQLRKTGKIHGYMRMYWAKKLLEWSESPQHALATAIYLNDSYSIDGGDPNGYVGILWSIAGLHDRAWTERPVYGTIRYMNEGGLRRKFDLDAYIAHWS